MVGQKKHLIKAASAAIVIHFHCWRVIPTFPPLFSIL
jgi:hypothetical protein